MDLFNILGCLLSTIKFSLFYVIKVISWDCIHHEACGSRTSSVQVNVPSAVTVKMMKAAMKHIEIAAKAQQKGQSCDLQCKYKCDMINA